MKETYLSCRLPTLHFLHAKPDQCTNNPCSCRLLTLRRSAVSGVNDSKAIDHRSRGSGCFCRPDPSFFFPPLCIHLLMGCLRNDTSLGYQAPFPASAQALRGRYPYGTQTHPLTSHKHQPRLVLNATVRLYVLQPALKEERNCPHRSSLWYVYETT